MRCSTLHSALCTEHGAERSLPGAGAYLVDLRLPLLGPQHSQSYKQPVVFQLCPFKILSCMSRAATSRTHSPFCRVPLSLLIASHRSRIYSRSLCSSSNPTSRPSPEASRVMATTKLQGPGNIMSPGTSTPTSTFPAAVVAEALPILDKIESAKRKAAYRAVADHFDSKFRFVGIGSGSTIKYGVEAIKEHLEKYPPPHDYTFFVPTGFQSRKVIEQAGLFPFPFDSLPEHIMLDVAFDGADEVDDELSCIKGGGACLFQEKLVATRAKKFVCVADYRKNQHHLLTGWPVIPIEVAPISQSTVMRQLKLLGSPNPKLREHQLEKTGPIQTDQGFYIIDAPFKPLLTEKEVANGADGSGKDGIYDVATLANKIKAISGVLEVGLFFGKNGYETQAEGRQGGQKPVAVYFGQEDGDVIVREAEPSNPQHIVTVPAVPTK